MHTLTRHVIARSCVFSRVQAWRRRHEYVCADIWPNKHADTPKYGSKSKVKVWNMAYLATSLFRCQRRPPSVLNWLFCVHLKQTVWSSAQDRHERKTHCLPLVHKSNNATKEKYSFTNCGNLKRQSLVNTCLYTFIFCQFCMTAC